MDKFDKDVEEIKHKYNNIKLSDEAKNRLKLKMENELNNSENKKKNKTVIFPRRLVATFACFVFLITSCAVFADEIECIVSNLFSNTERELEIAIENGNYKEIDMDYIGKDGIGIKVDYVIQDEDSLSIAFNVRSEEEFDNIYFENIEIKANEEYINYGTDISKHKINKKKINSRNIIIIYSMKTNNKVEAMDICIINVVKCEKNKEKVVNDKYNFYLKI